MTVNDATEDALQRLSVIRRLVVSEAAGLLGDAGAGPAGGLDTTVIRALLKAHAEAEAAFRDLLQIPD